MVAYGILLLPLIRDLKEELPDVNQPWYADDSGAGGSFAGIRQYFLSLQKKGPRRGYFPEPSKSILVVQEHNKAAAKIAFKDLGFTIVTGTRYLGGFVGSAEDQSDWVKSKTSDWVAAVHELSQVAARYPQSAYAGLQKSLQQEWQFLQRVTEGLDSEFEGIEEALTTKFLPALFGAPDTDSTLRQLACLPVKKSGLAIPNPTTTADENWTNSTVVCGHLIAALRGTEEFRSADHNHIMSAGRAEMRLRKLSDSEAKLANLLSDLPKDRARTIKRGQHTGAWLSALPSTVNGTELSAQEFRDAISMRYGITPSDLPVACDGCDARFSLQHALACKKGGLVIFRHNEIRDELIHLASKAFTPSAVRDEPLIRGRSTENVNLCSPSETSDKQPTKQDDRGDILLRGFWARGTECIVDVRVTDTDANSYKTRDPASVLKSQEKEKKRKYLAACLEQRRHFTPFVVSTDGMLGREASTFAKRLSAKLAEKWQKPYSQVCGYINVRLSIAIVRATHLCLRGSRVPAHNISV
jgi:hypothetical protein